MLSAAAATTSAAASPSDAELVARALAGRREAFNELVVRHERRLFRFLSRNASDDHQAEDAAQQAMVKAYVNLHRYDARWSFATWLFTIALRELRSLQRRRQRERRLGSAPIEHADLHPAAAPVETIDAADLWSAARRLLTAPQYTVLWLRYGEDLSPREVARVMRRPRVWVGVTLHRACAALRRQFGKVGEPASEKESNNVV